MIADDTPHSSDGRRRRSEQSRVRIVDAVMALVAEGHITPSAENVAARAGVGLRSVFRHFKDMESLYAEIWLSNLRFYEAARVPFASADWRGKLDEMIERRTGIYEQLLPFKRASDAHRHESPTIEANQQAVSRAMRERLVQVLPAAIAGKPLVFEAMDMLLSFECWQRLRFEQQLDPVMARQLIANQISLITAAA
jgi:AcrR family transcriptional regulator